MILRAANLVFATTNSAAIERLLEERGLFDWTIIEESSKATGGELLGPLLLSHRRLMIGDHKQLPPFDSDKMTKILAEPSDVKASIVAAKGLISRYLKDPGIDDIFEEVKTETSDFGRTCSDTLAVFTLFENFVEKELARQKSSPGRRPIARRLEEQHRMHPAIARIVSKCFYDGALTTFLKKEKEFLEGRAPFISTHPNLLPELPVVFIDLIYAREAPVGERTGDKAPPWSNPDEVTAVMKVLELIRPLDGGSTPSLAILSPYRKQVKELRESIASHVGSTLPHLSSFIPAIDLHEYCGTVDSFQGGEADLVLVSLVRNNVHVSPGKALGFLRDSRRMNVLLSRAKWRMILIGSLAFYRNVVETASHIPNSEIGFLGEFLDVLEQSVAANEAAVVPFSKLMK